MCDRREQTRQAITAGICAAVGAAREGSERTPSTRTATPRRIDERRECQKGGGGGIRLRRRREREVACMHTPSAGAAAGRGIYLHASLPPACVCRPRAIFLSPSVEFSSVPSRNRRIVLPACAPRLRGHRPTCMQHFPRVLASSRSYM